MAAAAAARWHTCQRLWHWWRVHLRVLARRLAWAQEVQVSVEVSQPWCSSPQAPSSTKLLLHGSSALLHAVCRMAQGMCGRRAAAGSGGADWGVIGV
jgi:hypothetical protein